MTNVKFFGTVKPLNNEPLNNGNLAPTVKFSCTEGFSTKLTSVQRQPLRPLQRPQFIETKPLFNGQLLILVASHYSFWR